MSQPAISFLGVGLMGAPMVARLLEAGFSLTLWNRTPAKAQVFSGRARLASSPSEAVAGADVVITMLESGQVVDQVLYQSGAIRQLRQGALVIDMSSIEPGLARGHGAQVEALGGGYLDAPVSGGTRGAQAGTLSIMVGGSDETFVRAAAVFQPLGTVTHIGPVGSGQSGHRWHHDRGGFRSPVAGGERWSKTGKSP